MDVGNQRRAGRPGGSDGGRRCSRGAGGRRSFPGREEVPEARSDHAHRRDWNIEPELGRDGELRRCGLHPIVLIDQQRPVRVMVSPDGEVLVGVVW